MRDFIKKARFGLIQKRPKKDDCEKRSNIKNNISQLKVLPLHNESVHCYSSRAYRNIRTLEKKHEYRISSNIHPGAFIFQPL